MQEGVGRRLSPSVPRPQTAFNSIFVTTELQPRRNAARKARSRTMKRIGIAALVLLWSSAAQAQVGSGWTAQALSSRLQRVGCVSMSGSTYKITCSASSGEQRLETRVLENFSSGQRQFQGDVKVTSLGGSGISLYQTKSVTGGTWLMLPVRSGGTLYCVNPGTVVASGVIGKSVRVNTVTNTGAKTTDVYINGALKGTVRNITLPAYHKYGTYRLNSGHG